MRGSARISWSEIKGSFCCKLPHGKSIFSDVWKYSTSHSNDLKYKKVNSVCIPLNGIFCVTFLKRHHSSFIKCYNDFFWLLVNTSIYSCPESTQCVLISTKHWGHEIIFNFVYVCWSHLCLLQVIVLFFVCLFIMV